MVDELERVIVPRADECVRQVCRWCHGNGGMWARRVDEGSTGWVSCWWCGSLGEELVRVACSWPERED